VVVKKLRAGTKHSVLFVCFCNFCFFIFCRGVMRGTDFKKKELQEKYGKHFLQHVLKKIEEENKSA
jgi:hypothetical protein